MAAFWQGTRIGRLVGPDSLTLKHLFERIGEAFDRMAERPLDEFGTPAAPLELPAGVDLGDVVLSDTAPDAMGALTISDSADGQGVAIIVEWAAVAGASTYEVDVWETADPTTVQRFKTSALSILVPVKRATSYTVGVYPVSALGVVGAGETDTHVSTTDAGAPAQVTGVDANGGLRAVVVTWDENTEIDVRDGAGTYEIEVYSDAGLTSLLVSARTNGTVGTLTDLEPDTSYWLRVRAVDSSGNTGDWSSTVTFTTSLVGTDDIAAASITGGMIQADQIDASRLQAITLEVGKYIESDNYVAATSGWRLDDDTAELNDVLIRGDLEIGTADAGPLIITRDEGIAIPLWNPAEDVGQPYINSIKWYNGVQGPAADYPAGHMYVAAAEGNYLDIIANQATTDGTVDGMGIGGAGVTLQARSVGGGTADVESFLLVDRSGVYVDGPEIELQGPAADDSRHAAGSIGLGVDVSNSGAVLTWNMAAVACSEVLRSSRIYQVVLSVSCAISVATDSFTFIVRDATTLAPFQEFVFRPNHTNSLTQQYIAEFAGNGTATSVQLRIERRSGTGTIAVFGATVPSRLSVKDVGSA